MAGLSTINEMRFPLVVRALNKCGALLDGALIRHGRADEFLAAAKKQTQLSDFGGTEFVEPLSRFLESAHREAQLNLVGKLALRSDVSRLLRTRLLMVHDRAQNPEIARQEIHQPLFIVGLPRTGTTLLHALLSADATHRAPFTWEVMQPSPPSDEQRAQRIQRTARDLAWMRYLAPDFGRVHAIGAELPQECVSLMSATFLSDQFDTMYNVPSYRNWFVRQNLQAAYRFHRRFLQHLQFARPGKRWILKAPAHMGSVAGLLTAYPDALFVQTHRAPLRSITSVSSLVTMLRRVFSDVVDPVKIGREALTYWAEMLERFMQERERRDLAVFDLAYTDLQHDPIAAVQQLYQYFDWPFSRDTQARMREVLAAQANELRTFHRYELAAFGLRLEEEQRYFGEYCQRFGVCTHQTAFRGVPAAAC
ncbi:MAG: sulfotransferase [Verrucomicrobia bacterium]|nr:sulfotransferase [Verrucomicrobiota bacterium]